jgi:2',3'-cyclic-nucleotide 2'-phosphodiesterase (5'-nucleotidase family)
VVLDAGDLLFPQGVKPGDAEVARAELLLEAAGEFGTAALAVGDRDLSHGVEWLTATAKKAKVPLLSANLATSDGKKPFEAHRVIEAGPTRVGVTGIWLSNAIPAPAGFTAADPVETAKAEVAALRKEGADVVVVLAHGTPVAANAIAAIEGVDLVIPSHVGSSGAPTRPGPTAGFVVGAGNEGKGLLQLDLSLVGAGTLVDANSADRARREIASLSGAISTAERLLAGAKSDEEKASREKALADYRAKLEALKVEAAKPPPMDRSTLSAQQRILGKGSPENEVWAEKLRRLEAKFPPPPGH